MNKFMLILMAPLCLRASSVGVPSPSMCFIYMRYTELFFNSGRSVILWVSKGHDAKYCLGSWNLDKERTSVPCSLCLSHRGVDSLTSSSISYLSFSLQSFLCRVWRWEAHVKHSTDPFAFAQSFSLDCFSFWYFAQSLPVTANPTFKRRYV